MRFARYTLVCLFCLVVAATPVAAGQTTPPPQAPTAAQQPAGPVRSLSIDEAVELALKNNLGLQIERMNPQIEDELVAGARAAYAPILSSQWRMNSSTSQPRDFTEGDTPFTTDSLSSSFTYTQQSVPWTNASFSATWNGSRSTLENAFAPRFNPSVGSSFSLQAQQPLWRNFLVNPVKNQIQQAVLSRQIADISLRQRVVGTERNVRSAYWSLVGAIQRLAVAKQNLDLSETQLKNNRVRVEVGTMAPIDIIAAQAEVAGNQEAVIVAEAAIKSAEDTLRMLIFDPNQPDFWTASIQPTNEPVLQPLDVNTEAAIKTALESRTDIVAQRRQLQISDLSLKLSKNQTMPDVSIVANAQGSANGGTIIDYVFGTEIETGREVRTFRQTLGDVFGFVYPNWSVGLNFSYPLGKAAAEANYARAQIQRRQQDAQLKQTEMSITQQVRQAARNVQSNFQRVQSTKVARELAEQRLAAQQKRFDVGLSTLFELTQAQRDVVIQRNAEVNAIIAYSQSLVDFQLVQVAPLGGI